MALPQDFIGVDIAKDWIDAFHLSTARHERISTTRQALARFAKAAGKALVVLEASGGYERPVIEALAKAGVGYARVNPRQAREFARLLGKLAKTDRVDAAILARMGKALELEPTQPADPDRQRLADLVARREGLVGMIRAEKNRAGTTRDSCLSREIALSVRMLQSHLAAVEEQIAILVETSDRLAAEARRLRSVPGIGPAVAAVLLARQPELGSLEARQIAALAGLALNACASGLSRGKRHIWGGRTGVRRALSLLRGAYAAPPGPRSPLTFLASRYDPSSRPSERGFRAQETHQGRAHRLRPKAPHHPQCHEARRQGPRETGGAKDHCYSATVIIQAVPQRSLSPPKPLDQKVGAKGIQTCPPSARASNTARAASTVGAAWNTDWLPLPRSIPGGISAPISGAPGPAENWACMTRLSAPGGRCPSGASAKDMICRSVAPKIAA